MSLIQSVGRVSPRVILVLLAGSLVAAVTWTLFPRLPPQRVVRDIVRPSDPDGDVPIPGSEGALRRAIHEMQTSNLSGRDSDVARARGPDLLTDQKMLIGLGPLRSVAYRGSGNGGDIYRAAFQNGSLTWRISLGRGRVITGLGVAAPEGPTPQDWIDHYELTPSSEGAGRLPLAFVKFLALVGIGRLARIRL